MPDVKISAGADPGTLVATDKVPVARSASTTAYAATMAEFASYANGAYTPNYYTGTPSMDSVGAPGTAAFVARGDHVHPSDTSRYSATNPSGYQTAAQVTTAVAPAFNGVGRNLCHNPLMAIAQRGAGPFTTIGYTLDRWANDFGGGTFSSSRIALTDADRAAVGDEAATYAMQSVVAGGASAGNYTTTFQRIEGVRRLSGKTITVSFWAKSASGTPKTGVSLDQSFGTGGSPSALVPGVGQSVTISSTFTRYSLTFSMPTTSGKTLGTNGDDFVIVYFWFSAGTTYATASGAVGVQSGTFNIWGVQLEIGSVATPLEKPDPRYDLANCQRFYQTGQLVITAYTTAGGVTGGYLALPVSMRSNPTVVIGSAVGGDTNLSAWGGPDYITTYGFRYYVAATASAVVISGRTFTASADL